MKPADSGVVAAIIDQSSFVGTNASVDATAAVALRV